MRKRSSLMIPFLCTFIAYNVVIGSRSCFCYWSWSTSCSVYPFNILIHFLLFLIFKIATAQPHDYVLQQPCVTPKIYIHTYIPISQCVHIYVQHKIDSVLMLQRRGKAVWTNVGKWDCNNYHFSSWCFHFERSSDSIYMIYGNIWAEDIKKVDKGTISFACFFRKLLCQ